MDEEADLVGHLYYGIGEDDEGYFCAVRFEWPDRSSRTMVAEARFRDFEAAYSFMRAMERDAQVQADLLGLIMQRNEIQN